MPSDPPSTNTALRAVTSQSASVIVDSPAIDDFEAGPGPTDSATTPGNHVLGADLDASESASSGSHSAQAADAELPDATKTQLSAEEPGSDDKTVAADRAPAGPNSPRPANQPRTLAQRELADRLIGQTLEHFELQDFIGGGGMGVVFRAYDTRLKRIVALKVLGPDAASHPETLKRFRVEAESTARLDHEGIARVYYVGEDRGYNFLAFEFIEGQNLRDLVTEAGTLPWEQALDLTFQIAKALDHASQRNVVHRDIKPSNVLVTPEGRAKLVDMGLARLGQLGANEDLTNSGATLGTFDYISPEQAHDPRHADVRSDIYSLGCSLYFMLTGHPPFPDGTMLQKLLRHQGAEPTDVREFNDSAPDELARVLRRMLAKNPRARHQTARELLIDLTAIADAHGLALSGNTGDYRVVEPLWMTLTRQHAYWLIPALALVLCVAVLDVFWSRGWQDQDYAPYSPLDSQRQYAQRDAAGGDGNNLRSEGAQGTNNGTNHGTNSNGTESGTSGTLPAGGDRSSQSSDSPNVDGAPDFVIGGDQNVTPVDPPGTTGNDGASNGGPAGNNRNDNVDPRVPELFNGAGNSLSPWNLDGTPRFPLRPPSIAMADLPRGERLLPLDNETLGDETFGDGTFGDGSSLTENGAGGGSNSTRQDGMPPVPPENGLAGKTGANSGGSGANTSQGTSSQSAGANLAGNSSANGSGANPAGSGDDATNRVARTPRNLVVDPQTNGTRELEFASLKSALEAARSGDRIELHFSGRLLEERAIRIPEINVTVRAGEGFRPVIVFRPESPQSARSMILVRGERLQVYGVSFELDLSAIQGGAGWSLFEIAQGSLTFEDCWLTVINGQNHPAASRSMVQNPDVRFITVHRPQAPGDLAGSAVVRDRVDPMGITQVAKIELRDCVARGEAAFVASDGTPTNLTWRNGVLATSGFLLTGEIDRERLVTPLFALDLKHLTACLGGGLVRINNLVGPTAPGVNLLMADCADSILIGDANSVLISQTAAEDPISQQSHVEWMENGVFYQDLDRFWEITDVNTPLQPLVLDEQAWADSWPGSSGPMQNGDVYFDSQADQFAHFSKHSLSAYRLDEYGDNAARNASSDGLDAGAIFQELPDPPSEKSAPRSLTNVGAGRGTRPAL